MPVGCPRSRPRFLRQDFVVGLSVLLRGTVHQKLKWAFNLYDINKDGYITKEVTRGGGDKDWGGRAGGEHRRGGPERDGDGGNRCWGTQVPSFRGFSSPCPLSVPSQEMLEIMKSIYDMMGRCTHPTLRDSAPAEHVELFFQVRAIPLVPSQRPPKPPLGVTGRGCPHPLGTGMSPPSPSCSLAEDGQER